MDGKLQDDRYRVINNIIYYKGRIYLVPESTFKKKVFQAFHDAPMACHQGFLKTYKHVRERFSWKELKGDIMRYIKECATCQQNKDEHSHPLGLLQPLPIPENKWEGISMDFITGLPRAHGKDCIFVVVDRLTKFSDFFAISMNYNTS
jgi:hypothetical protein